MEGYISFAQLGQLILFLMLLVACSYAIITLRNVNVAVKAAGELLKENKKALNLAISNVALASQDVVVLTSELRGGLGEASRVIGTADQIATYAVVIAEAAKTFISAFASTRK